MNREIKFRAWDIDEGKMQYSCISMGSNGAYWQFADQGFLINDEEKTEFILMQFTGLKDKNGVEIFEGDILSDKAVVEWFNKLSWDSGGSMHPGFYAKRWVSYDYEDGEYELSYHDSFRDVEVIGNIFESPELIEK